MKSAGKARNNGLYRHIRTSKEIIRNLLNYYHKKINFVRAGSNTFTFTICKIQVTGVCRIQVLFI